MAYPSWTPRLALILIALPCGVLALVAAARSRDRAAWFSIAAIVVGGSRGCGRRRTESALIGFAGRDLSAPRLRRHRRRCGPWDVSCGRRASAMVRNAVLAGLLLSAFVGVFQVLFEVDTGYFALHSGRPSGLATNPVYFGGLMAAGVVIAAGEARRTACRSGATSRSSRRWRWASACPASASHWRHRRHAGFVAIRSGVRSMGRRSSRPSLASALGWTLDRSQRRRLERPGSDDRFGQPRLRTADRRLGIRARRHFASVG